MKRKQNPNIVHNVAVSTNEDHNLFYNYC